MSDSKQERDAKTCPKCGLLVAFSWEEGERPPPETPTCNPIRSPDCWRVIGKTTQPDQFGRKHLLKLVTEEAPVSPALKGETR